MYCLKHFLVDWTNRCTFDLVESSLPYGASRMVDFRDLPSVGFPGQSHNGFHFLNCPPAALFIVFRSGLGNATSTTGIVNDIYSLSNC